MKKLMFSLCALCIVGAAGAQVSRVPLSKRVQGFQKIQSAIIEPQNLDMQVEESMPARKAAVEGLDSVQTQSAYGKFSLGAETLTFARLYPDQVDKDPEDLDPCYEDMMAFVFGTGGVPSMAGSGEFGYRFATGPGTWYTIENYYPDFGVPYAVKTTMIRWPSTSLRHIGEDGKAYYDSMPLYFKLYNSTKVGEQQVFDLTTPREENYLDVVYPTDPEKYTALSETVMVGAHDCEFGDEGKIKVPYFNIKAEFLNVDASQRLGDNFCISMVYPIEWDEEGDSVILDSRWNISPYIVGKEWLKDSKISETPHCTYLVHDYSRLTSFWEMDGHRPEDHKRFEYLVLDSAMQPNMRYAVMPMDGMGLDGEPYLRILYTNWVSLQSANKADRYVQLSPVPATDYVNFTSYTDMSRIEIYSLGGQLVKAVNVSGDTYRLDLTGINSGMYVARIVSEKGISSKKLIVR